MKKILTNVEITNQVISTLEADTEHEYFLDFSAILSLVDVSGPNETEPVDIDNIIDNFKQRLEFEV